MNYQASIIFFLTIVVSLCGCNNEEIISDNLPQYPSVISTIPSINAVDVPIDVIIAITYDSCCNIEEILPLKISISNLDGIQSRFGQTVSFKPVNYLGYNTEYEVTATDNLHQISIWKFKTIKKDTLPEFPETP